jgi:hypothetical protein
MPRAFARSASSSPTILAAATLPPAFTFCRKSGARLSTAARVRPLVSSITCA